MSLFHPAIIVCPTCQAQVEIERSASVNADLRPDLRAAILDGSFQSAECPSCATKLRLPPHLTVIELDRNVWIAVEPASQIEDWSAIEDSVWRVYDRAFGAGAPRGVRDLAEFVRPRLVFGWPALREKLLAADLQLDDITLELLKMAVMRSVDGPPIADESELRLTGGDDGTLHLAWFHQTSEEVLASLDVPRGAYDAIIEKAASWAPLREKLEGVFLVDLRRFIAGPVAQAA